MLKKVLTILIVMQFALVNVIYAAADENTITVINANEEGIVEVSSEVAPDKLNHNLIELNPDAAAAVMTTSNNSTNLIELDYTKGYFDRADPSEYSVSNHRMIDNDLQAGAPIQITDGEQTRKQTVTFSNAVDIVAFYYATQLGGSSDRHTVFNFYLNGEQVRVYRAEKASSEYVYIDGDGISVDKIEIAVYDRAGTRTTQLLEFEVFVKEQEIEYESVKNVNVTNIQTESALLTYSNPESNYFSSTDVYLNDVLISSGDVSKNRNLQLDNLTENTEYTIKIRANYKDGNYIDTLYTFKTNKDTEPPENVSSFIIEQRKETAVLSWVNPADKDFSHVAIYRNDALIKDNVKDTTYIDLDVKYDTNYTYKIVSYDLSGNVSSGAVKQIKLVEIKTDVEDLKAVAKDYTEVMLTWKNPTVEDFETVTIYRKKEAGNILKRMFSMFSSNNDYTPIFQTNGTMFKDLTVEAATTYEYKLTTLVAGVETEGVTTKVTTPKIHALDTEVVTNEESGDYTLKWSAPNKGQMKVLIDGAEYKIVPAADLQVTIPKSKIPTDVFGDPKLNKIQLIPISEAGEEGMPVSPGENGGGGIGGSKITDIFSVKDLVKAAMDLLLLVGPFVLLVLAFLFSDRIMNLLKRVYQKVRTVD